MDLRFFDNYFTNKLPVSFNINPNICHVIVSWLGYLSSVIDWINKKKLDAGVKYCKIQHNATIESYDPVKHQI